MKKLFISFLFSFLIFIASAATVGSYKTYVITNAGGSYPTAPANIPDVIYLAVNGSTTLVGNFSISATTTPTYGTHFRVYFQLTDLDVNGHTVSIFGYTLNPEQLLTSGYYDFWVVGLSGSPVVLYNYAPYDFDVNDAIWGGAIQDGTVELSALASDIPLSFLDTVGRARILIGNASGEVVSYYTGGSGKILVGDGSDLKSVSVTGDISLTTAGVTYIDSATIRDSSIATGAAIKRQKLATGTASYVVINSAGGIMTEEAQLNPLRGGTGTNTSASTGFATVSSGSWSVGALTDVRDLHVSFATSSQGTYYIYFPVAVTVTNIEVRVETALSATDSATIAPQNNSGTAMAGGSITAGLLVLAASATTGTGYTSTLTSNNTFAAGERMRIITNKGTVGGTANVQVTYTRTQ